MYFLRWGVKASFRRYVSGLPDGLCEVSGDVELPGRGEFAFAFAGVSPSASRLDFAGGLLFTGHGGFLRLAIVDPSLERRADAWALHVADPSVLGGTIELGLASPASSDLDGGLLHFDMSLTDAGAAVFGGNYPAGTVLDPLVVRVPPSVLKHDLTG